MDRWFTALACIKTGGLRMFHPDACIYKDRVVRALCSKDTASMAMALRWPAPRR